MGCAWEERVQGRFRGGIVTTLSAILLAGVVLVCPGRAHGLSLDRETGQYVHRTWRAGAESLPSAVVLAVTQTRDGYLWLGTENGLVRFNGVDFVTFDTDNTPALRHNHVEALAEDRDGRLWAGTWGGGAACLENGAWSSLTAREGLAGDLVRSIHQGVSGPLWLATMGGGLSAWDGQRFETRTDADGLLTNELRAVFVDGVGTLWVGTRNRGLLRSEGTRFVAVGKGTALESAYVTSLAEDPAGGLWVGTAGQGLFRVKGEGLEHFGAEAGLPSQDLNCLHLDRDGNLWMGSRGAGLLRLRHGRFTSFTSLEGLSNDHVNAVFEDREGSLWVGTFGGLDRFTNGTAVTYTTAEGLSNDMVWPVLQDGDGAMWVGTWAGLNRLRDGRFEVFTREQGLPANGVFALAEGAGGRLWVGTFGGGIVFFRDGRFERVPELVELDSITIWAILEDPDGALWIGTNGQGLFRFSGGRLERVVLRSGGGREIISAIFRGPDGRLWVALRTEGLCRQEGGGFRCFGMQDGLPSDEVRAIHADGAGTIWVGTRGGLSRWKDGRFETLDVRRGLPDRTVYWILEDESGFLWVSSGRGIYRLSPSEATEVLDGVRETVHPQQFGFSDGMKFEECNGGAQPAGWRGRDGRLWFPTGGGLVTIDPRLTFTNTAPPPVLLESVVVDGRALDGIGNGGTPVELKYGFSHLEIHFAGLSMAAPERNRYKVKLDGLDDDWVDAGSRRTAYYTSLPPGRYRFHVMASNNSGIWNEEGAGFAFTVKPRFYQTVLFYGLAALGFFLMGVGILYLRIRRMRAHQAELERIVAERTAELAEANKRLSRACSRLEETNELLEDSNRQLECLATTDGLTGLTNRRRFDEVLELEWRRHQRHGRPLALIMVDVDFFKAFNDTYGHPGGDEVLRSIARVVRETFARADDLPARLGGEEFGALLPETTLAAAMNLGEVLRTRIERLGMQHSASQVARCVTASVGVAAFVPSAGTVAMELLGAADAALYQAKRAGRNRVHGVEGNITDSEGGEGNGQQSEG